MPNRYTFNTTLEGFINVGEPSGKYNNMCFAFIIPSDVLEQVEQDYEGLMDWAKSKVPNPNRVSINARKWGEDGLVKYSFGGDTSRPDLVFVDTDGQILDTATRKSIRKGTKVRLICDQKPYTKPSVGTTIKVLGVQVIELVAGAVSDSGEMTTDDIVSMFSEDPVDGYKAASPSPKAAVGAKAEDYEDF
tara:strand:- start:16670 stop:17239 length:570 start_codon:yes stop_codon:yes gene_type:complete